MQHSSLHGRFMETTMFYFDTSYCWKIDNIAIRFQDPYLEVPEAATYELSSCYNVSIDCRASDMVARIQTSKLFDGKIYAKGSPNSCVVDVKQSLEFELHMGYNNLECNVKQNGLGR